MNGTVFDIQRFCVHDGPGIRTTVFLKGCSLRCRWCHNPEGLSPAPQAQFFREECVGCGSCRGEHTLENAAGCPVGALKVVGKEMSSEEVLEAVLADREFYGADGGVTFSGGECLLQPGFVKQMLTLLRQEGVSTAIDTCGAVSWRALEGTLGLCDTYLYDVKCADSRRHREYTGRDNGQILENLKKLTAAGACVWIRIPVIPGFNDTQEEIAAIGRILAPLPGIRAVTLIPYHTLGKSKYETLGMTPSYHTDVLPAAERMELLRDVLRSFGLPVEER